MQPSASKRKRAREARKVEKILQGLLEDKAISGMEKVAGLEEIKWVRGRSKSAKQAMIARVSRRRSRFVGFLFFARNDCHPHSPLKS